jgi:hypothetical protein
VVDRFYNSYSRNIFYAATFPLWFDSNPTRWFSNGTTGVGYITRSLIFLAYWTYFESTSGQSIGKKLVQIKTVGISGEALSILENSFYFHWMYFLGGYLRMTEGKEYLIELVIALL